MANDTCNGFMHCAHPRQPGIYSHTLQKHPRSGPGVARDYRSKEKPVHYACGQP